MVKKFNAGASDSPKCCGGEGVAKIDLLFDTKTFYSRPTWMGMVTLGPNDTVGYHQHTRDMEIYTVVKGKGIFNDNGTEVIVEPGDTTVTKIGEWHGIKAYDCDELSFVATVIAEK